MTFYRVIYSLYIDYIIRRKEEKKKEESISLSLKEERRNISNRTSVESFISTSSSDMSESALSHIAKFMETRPLGQTSLKQFGIGVNGKAPLYPLITRLDDEKDINGYGF